MKTEHVEHEVSRIHQAFNDGVLDAVIDCYHHNATLVVKPGTVVSGKENIVSAYEQVHTSLGDANCLNRGDKVLIEAGDTALLISKTYLSPTSKVCPESVDAQRSIHVFKKDEKGNWRCLIDNFYGTDLLDYV